MSEMKRYFMSESLGLVSADEHPQGGWVKFEDVQKELQHLRDELTAMTLERDALKRALSSLGKNPR